MAIGQKRVREEVATRSRCPSWDMAQEVCRRRGVGGCFCLIEAQKMIRQQRPLNLEAFRQYIHTATHPSRTEQET
jgi:hypothetical protein